MLAFLDESGDAGRHPGRGSSLFFVGALVVFADRDEALRCEHKIRDVRAMLGLSPYFEFHFAVNSHRQRMALLDAVAPFRFSFNVVAVDKAALTQQPLTLVDRESLYGLVYAQVLRDAKPELREATLVVDGSLDRSLRERLRSNLKAQVNDIGAAEAISKIRMERSRSNDLLQLADYVAGIYNRLAQGKAR